MTAEAAALALMRWKLDALKEWSDAMDQAREIDAL